MEDFSLTAARTLASVINPALASWLLTTLRGQDRGSAVRWTLTCVAGVGVAVALAESGKRYEVWPHHPYFPSGHETFACSCIAFLVMRDRRFAAAGIPLAVVMGWALVRAGYHAPVDVAAGACLGAAVATAAGATVARQVKKRETTAA